MTQKTKAEREQKEREDAAKKEKEKLKETLKNIHTDESQAIELIKQLDDIPDGIEHRCSFAKQYIIMLLQEYCQRNVLTEHERDFFMAMCGLLHGYEFEKDEDGRTIAGTIDRRKRQYWENAKWDSDLFKKNKIDLNGSSIITTLGKKLKEIVEKTEKQLIVDKEQGNGKLGLIDDVITEFKKPEVFDGNKLFLPKSIFAEHNLPNDNGSDIETEKTGIQSEESPENTTIEEGFEDSETHSLESSSNLTDELYDMFLELRTDSNFFETIVKKLDYLPTKLEPELRDDFYKLYIIKLIQNYCKSPNEAEFILAVYGLLRRFERIKYKNADMRQKAYFKYAYGYNLYIQIDIYDEEEIASSLSKKFEKSLNYLATKLAEKLSNNDGKLGLVNDVINEFDEHNNKLILPKLRMGVFKEAMTNPRKRKHILLFLAIIIAVLLILVLAVLCERSPLQDKPEPNKTDSSNESSEMNEKETDDSTIDDMMNSIDAFMLGGVNEQLDEADWYYESTHEETVNPDGSITTRDRKVLGHGSVTNTIKEPDTWNSSDDEVKK